MFKKIGCIVILSLLFLSMTYSCLSEPITPLTAAECNITATISFSNKKAQAVGTVTKLPSGYSVSTSVILQKKSGNSWIEVASASGGREVCASFTAIKGVTYRAYATCKLYDKAGVFVDSIAATSSTKMY